MRLWLTIGAVGFAMFAWVPGPASADEVAVPVQDRIEEKLSSTFFSPQTTLWHFDTEKAYVNGERTVCGWVNFQSAQQTYVGYHQFYAIIDHGEVRLAQIEDPVSDTTGVLASKLKSLCGIFKRPV